MAEEATPEIHPVEDGVLLVGDIEYSDRRMGITWPGPKNPGYLCVFGLERRPDPATGQRTLRLLQEDEAKDLDLLFQKAAGYAGAWHCRDAYALGGHQREYFFDAYSIWARKKNYSFLRLHDVSDISTFDAGRAAAVSRAKKRALDIWPGSILRGQVDAVTPEEVRTAEGMDPNARWHAAGAMNHVLVSHEYFPWEKPMGKSGRVKAGEGYR